jgi:hypothetical protein
VKVGISLRCVHRLQNNIERVFVFVAPCDDLNALPGRIFAEHSNAVRPFETFEKMEDVASRDDDPSLEAYCFT